MDLAILKNQMKKFETMVNTADIDLANELVDSKAPFLLLHSLSLFMVVRGIYH